jgi:tetratricopeptide (TPR) repeat protein
LDVSRVPARPSLGLSGHFGTPARRDAHAPTGGLASVIDSAYDNAITNPIELDTNDSRLYYVAGMAARHSDPAGASAAFYWASRLDPSWAQPYYARWYLLRTAAEGALMIAARTTSAAKQPPLPDSLRVRIDSLVLMAYSRDPYFDDGMTLGDMSTQIRRQVNWINNSRRAALERINDQRFRQGEPPLMANLGRAEIPHEWYIAYGNRDFAGAAAQLAVVIKKHPEAIGLYVYRAKAQFFLAQYDSAAATMQAAIARMEKVESAKTLPVYFSKEGFAYAVGIAEQRAGHDSAARAAYQRTVTENLGSYMGHLHLSNAALAVDDTATAITEARVAAEIRPDDPVVQLFLGYALLNAGQTADAAAHLGAAVRADSAYALPYLYLARATLTERDTAGTLLALRGFLARARQDDSQRATAQALVTAMSGAP